MKRLLFIALGGATGAVVRYLVAATIEQFFRSPFPLGTLIVNTTGSFAMGLLFELSANLLVPPAARQFVGIGFLGSYTTLSTLAVETSSLFREREIAAGAFYVEGTVLASLFLCYAGMTLGRFLGRALQ